MAQKGVSRIRLARRADGVPHRLCALLGSCLQRSGFGGGDCTKDQSAQDGQCRESHVGGGAGWSRGRPRSQIILAVVARALCIAKRRSMLQVGRFVAVCPQSLRKFDSATRKKRPGRAEVSSARDQCRTQAPCSKRRECGAAPRAVQISTPYGRAESVTRGQPRTFLAGGVRTRGPDCYGHLQYGGQRGNKYR